MRTGTVEGSMGRSSRCDQVGRIKEAVAVSQSRPARRAVRKYRFGLCAWVWCLQFSCCLLPWRQGWLTPNVLPGVCVSVRQSDACSCSWTGCRRCPQRRQSCK